MKSEKNCIWKNGKYFKFETIIIKGDGSLRIFILNLLNLLIPTLAHPLQTPESFTFHLIIPGG